MLFHSANESPILPVSLAGKRCLGRTRFAHNIALEWSSSGLNLYFNGALVRSTPFSPLATNWTSTSNFDLGAYEYLNYNGFYALDDVIGGFTVNPPGTISGFPLKVAAKKHLHLSRGLRREDFSKTSGAVRIQVGQVQILPIQKVERLNSQQPRRPLRKLEATRQGEIDGREARSNQDVATGRAEHIGCRNCECRRVEPKIR